MQAPAKVNLALDILGRREDGYHDLSTVMQTISLADTVEVRRQPSGFSLTVQGEAFPLREKTMEQRAAEAFFSSLGQPVPGLAVTLSKVTPAYGGLGGGSADIAAMLRLLRREYCPDMQEEALEAIGLTVGSDIPFCLRGGTALAQGRGERLRDLPALPQCWFVVCKPAFGIPTPELFALVDKSKPQFSPDIEGMIRALESGDLAGIAARMGNVFEEYLPRPYWEIFSLKEALLAQGALGAAMSGSGSAVFGLFVREREAREAAAVLKETGTQTFVARPVSREEMEQ